MKPALLMSLSLGMAVCARGEYFFETFESAQAGSTPIGIYPGWSGAGLTAVTTSRPHEGVRSLRLPAVGGPITLSSAVYSNLNYHYTPGSGHIARISAQLYRSGIQQSVSLHLGIGGTNIVRVGTSLDGRLTLNSVTTTAAFVTGRYAQVTFFCDFAAQKAGLEYDGAVILGWSNLLASTFTRFDSVWFERKAQGGGDSGEVYLDNVSVEVFPAGTVFWWRFEETNDTCAAEHTHRFAAAGSSAMPPRIPLLPELDAGEDVVLNRGAIVWPSRHDHIQLADAPGSTRWTLEFIAKMTGPFTAGGGQKDIFHWVHTNVPPNPRMLLYIPNLSLNHLNLTYRDDGGNGAGHDFGVAIPMDARWHHVAVVSQATAVELYLDYALVSFSNLTNGEGACTFRDGALAQLGAQIASSETNLWVDEVRFTAASLAPTQFLRLPAPRFLGIALGADTNTMTLRALANPETGYDIEFRRDLSPAGAWERYGSTGVAFYESDITVRTNRPAVMYRLREP